MYAIPSFLSAQDIIEHSIVTPKDEKEQQRQLIASWMARFKDDYVAHAVWGDNFAKVVESGAVLPAEAVLRTTGNVEYEKGGLYGQRGRKTDTTSFRRNGKKSRASGSRGGKNVM